MIRALARTVRSIFSRSYDGAAGGRRWRGAGEMQRQLAAMNAARGPISRRARYLVGNNALAASAENAWGFSLAPMKPQSAHPDEATRGRINALFTRWNDEADADGRADFDGLQTLAVGRMVTDGDVFATMSLAETRSGAPLRLRLIDGEQVDPLLHREIGGGARIISGVEFDTAGRRAAYHVFRERPGLPLNVSLDVLRLPAEDVVHLFKLLMPGQVRGLSWFAPVLLRLHDLDEAHDAQLVRQKVAALLAGFIYDSEGGAGGFEGKPSDDGLLEGGLEPGTIKVLTPGKQIVFSEPAKVGAEVIDFLKISAREVAVGLGLPYEMLTGDLSDVNYSSIRAGLIDFRRRVELLQFNLLVFQFCRPIWRRFITTAVLSGVLQAPGFERDPEPYFAVNWIPPRSPWVDPEKDVNAEVTAIGAGLMSRRQAVAARGYDLEELDREIAADNARAEALGLKFEAKPAAVSKPDPAEEEDAAGAGRKPAEAEDEEEDAAA